MKIYVADNLDGVNRAMVIAPNLKEAARRFGTSQQQLRAYGWHYATDKERDEMMKLSHSHVVFAPIDHKPPHTYWSVGRWTSTKVREAHKRARSFTAGKQP